jgi:hypothetical protein
MTEQEEFKEAYNTCLNIRKYCEDNDIFYLKLDIEIPEGVLDEAMFLYEKGYFVTHRAGYASKWYSSTLHGKDWDKTTYRDSINTDELKWTKISEYCPIMTSWLKNEFPNDGRYRRCRFMLIEPGGYITSHTDQHGWVPGDTLQRNIFSAINIAITQPEDCYLRRSDTMEEVPFVPRSVFLFDNNVHHEAANFSKENRFHFIIHAGDQCVERANLYISSFKKQYPNAIV